MSVSTLSAARFYRACGYSVVPVLADGTKKPAVAWEHLKHTRASGLDLTKWFSDGRFGIALIQGAVSGGAEGTHAELLEFETREIYNKWYRRMEDDGLGDMLSMGFPCVASPGGGVHLYYRHTGEATGNKKLARGLSKIPGHNGDTLIETRGEGGYVLAPGSPAGCHQSGVEYKMLGGSIKEVPVLTESERSDLLRTCRLLDERPAKPTPIIRPSFINVSQDSGQRPGDDFNERGAADALACLMRHGWTIERDFGDYQTLCRPGKTLGCSATFGFIETGRLYVFSSNAPDFEPESISNPFEIVTRLDFGGDFKACAKSLAQKGYGSALVAYNPQGNAKPGGRKPQAKRVDLSPLTDVVGSDMPVEDTGEGWGSEYCYVRLLAATRLSDLGLASWPELPESVSTDLREIASQATLGDVITMLRSELGTSRAVQKWVVLREIDDLLDENDVYISHPECMMHYIFWYDNARK